MSWCVVPHGLCIWSAVEIESPTCPEENPLTLLCTTQNTFLSRMHSDCGDVLCFLPLYSSFVSSSGLLCLERICWNLSHLSPPPQVGCYLLHNPLQGVIALVCKVLACNVYSFYVTPIHPRFPTFSINSIEYKEQNG